MRKDISFAKVDPAFFVDGLFFPRANTNNRIDVERKFDGGKIRFMGCQLGTTHQSILLGLCARTALAGSVSEAETEANKLRPEKKLIESITDDVTLEHTSHCLVKVTAYSLLKDSGMATGSNQYESLQDILTELASITVYRAVDNRGGVSRLLSFEHVGDKLSVCLNWRLADAIFSGHNIQVSLHERRQLKSPVAKLLHAWLSAHIRLGRSLMEGQGVMIDTLCRHIWAEDNSKEVKPYVASKRRRLAKEGLMQIDSLEGWVVELTGSKSRVKAQISRPLNLPSK